MLKKDSETGAKIHVCIHVYGDRQTDIDTNQAAASPNGISVGLEMDTPFSR